jgi:hypothetical protein
MKIRNGFVSNSSSSCFICGEYGGDNYSVEATIEALQKMVDFQNSFKGLHQSFEDIFETPRYATEEDVEFLVDWGNSREDIEGKLLIFSAEDNSISYDLFELIESKFSARRQHLG